MSVLEIVSGVAFVLTVLVGAVVCWGAGNVLFHRMREDRQRSEARFRSWMMFGFAVIGVALWGPWLAAVLPSKWSWIAAPEAGLIAGLFVGYWVAKSSAVFLGYESEELHDAG
jgi:hypothetical protein